MKQVKTTEELEKVKEYYGEPIYSININFTEKGELVSGMAIVETMPMIFVHGEGIAEVVKNYYVALGKAISQGTPRIAIACNNEKLEEILINKEGFKPLNFKVLVKEI